MRFTSIILSLALVSSAFAKPVSSSSAMATSTMAPAPTTPAAVGPVAPVAAPSGPNAQDGVYISCNRPGVFAMTFDDGPYQYSWDLAKKLNGMGVKATFFINGKNWVNVETDSVETSDGKKTYMEIIQHYQAMGHQVASHTYEHKVLAGLSESDVEYQMNTLSDIIQKAIGVRPAHMRPPTGGYDQNTLATLRKLGYHVVNWDIDTNDWKNHNFKEEQDAYKLIDKATPTTLGHIALEHEVYDQTVNELVPWAVEYVKSKNLEFVTVADCLGFPAYYQ